jgi:glycogen synthase
MRILVLTNLYPPHQAGTAGLRAQQITDALRLRGHQTLVLTSTHSMTAEQADSEVERRLHLNGAFDHPLVTKYGDMKSIETHNHAVLHDVLGRFAPDLVHVHSLLGLSKSLIFALRHARVPVVYDIADHWLTNELPQDPWLRWWNAPSLPLMSQSARKTLELSGERNRLDSTAPTRMVKGVDRLPEVFGDEKTRAQVEPNSVGAFHFDRLYFLSHALKNDCERAGFRVNHAEIIYPGIPAEALAGEVKPVSAPMHKFLIATTLNRESGVKTALEALGTLRQARVPVSLTVCGQGESSYIAELRSLAVTKQLPVEFPLVRYSPREMPSIYRRHDVFLYTAEWPEPFSVAPLEAMACGLPVIGARSGGMQEFLRDGENALTYTPGNAQELASRIYDIQLQPALRFQMAETAQSEVLAYYNETAVIDRIENYLNTSLEIWAQVLE